LNTRDCLLPAFTCHLGFWSLSRIPRYRIPSSKFWNATDLEGKLETFRQYYNTHRVHSSLDGDTPSEITRETIIRRADLNNFL